MEDSESKILIIPLLIKLVYKPVLSIHIPPSLTTSSAANSPNETAPAVRVGTGIAIPRRGSLAAEKIPKRRKYDNKHVLFGRERRGQHHFLKLATKIDQVHLR